MKVCIFAVCFGALAFACGTESDYELYDGSDQASYAAKGGGGGGGGKPPKDGGEDPTDPPADDAWSDYTDQCCADPGFETTCYDYCLCAAGPFAPFFECAYCEGDPTCENQCYMESASYSCTSACGPTWGQAQYCQ